MTTRTLPHARRARRGLTPPFTILARLQIRQTARLLLLMLVGLIMTITLTGAMPLYVHIANTYGLRSFFTQDARNQQLSLTVQTAGLTTSRFQAMEQGYTAYLRSTIGAVMQDTVTSSIVMPGLSLVDRKTNQVPTTNGNELSLIGAPLDQVGQQIPIIQGRLPNPQATEFEVAITADGAQGMGVRVGDSIAFRFYSPPFGEGTAKFLNVRVVGIIKEPSIALPYWDQNRVGTVTSDAYYVYKGIVSQPAMLNQLTQLAKNGDTLAGAPTFWLYELDPAKLDSANLDTLIDRFNAIQVRIKESFNFPQATPAELTGNVFLPEHGGTIFTQYRDQIIASAIPSVILYIGVLGIGIFFASLIAELVIERQTTTIAVLRSRGFSRPQIFLALALQGLLLAALGLGIGAVLTLPTAQSIAQWQFGAHAPAITVITRDPLHALREVQWFILIAAGSALLALLISLWQAMRLDIVALRRESARSQRPPLWQRLNLDVVVALVAIVAYGIGVYLRAAISGVDARIDRLLTPAYLLAPVLIAIALLFLFLRGFTLLLRGGARIAQRGRGALAMLGLTQVARSPREAIRMTMLLALALSFGIFLVSFSASQAMRAADIAAFQSGADFSGGFNAAEDQRQNLTLADQSKSFQGLPGVQNVVLGFVDMFVASDATLPGTFQLQAVDAEHYPTVAVWPPTAPDQTPASLMARLIAARPAAIQEKSIPAFVDALTWNTFHLTPGATFNIGFASSRLLRSWRFTALGMIAPLPTTPVGTGGILADYTTFQSLSVSTFNTKIFANHLWAASSDDPTSLRIVRDRFTLGKYSLTDLRDRRATIDRFQRAPLSLTLAGLALVATVMPLVLAVLGNLVASWLRAQRELRGFAVLRALGARPRQITGVLLWEQILVYGMALLIGGGLGWFLTRTLLPDLIFTTAPSVTGAGAGGNNFFLAQSVPTVRVVIPETALFALGIIICTGLLALGIMTAVASRPTIGQTLRLNED